MGTIDRERLEPPMSDEEAEAARIAQRCLMEALDRSRAPSIRLKSDSGNESSIVLPPRLLRLFAHWLGALSERRPIVVIPGKRELSTNEAATFLNVSRPFVIKEIEAGRLCCRKVGTHRRIEFDELRAYKDRMREQQQTALQRMADNARELGLDDY